MAVEVDLTAHAMLAEDVSLLEKTVEDVARQ
jgi:hypothetical protein